MTTGRIRQRAECAMLGLRPSSQLLQRWAILALGVMLMISVSESGRTFASLVTDSRGRGDIRLPAPQRPGTMRPEQVPADLAFRERELLRSIELGEVAYAESLLAAGISANAKDPHGWTPLMLAALHNRIPLVSVLCVRGAELNAQNVKGTTALMLAANNGHREMVHLLLDRGARVNAKTTGGWTALMYAAWKGHAEIVTDLLRSGANPTATDTQGWTALMYTAWQGHTEIVQILLGSQKVKTVNERERKQARTLAASQGHSVIVDFLDQAEKHG